MAYKGGYNKRGRRNTNYMRKYYKGKSSRDLTYGRMGQKVFTDTAWLVNKVHQLSGLINTEFKSNDTDGATTVTTTPLILLISGLARGDDLGDRDGRMVRWKSVSVKLQITMHATPIDDMIRIMVVIDKQPNETLLVIGDLLLSVTPQGQKNLSQRRRFVILKDEVISLSVGEGTTRFFQWYKKIDMKTIFDDSDAGTIADIETNAMYLILFGTEATNGITVGRTTRLRFIDN